MCLIIHLSIYKTKQSNKWIVLHFAFFFKSDQSKKKKDLASDKYVCKHMFMYIKNINEFFNRAKKK